MRILTFMYNYQASDTLFTWKDLQAKLNSELLNNLGNYVNRVLSFIAKPKGQSLAFCRDNLGTCPSDAQLPRVKVYNRIANVQDQVPEKA